MERFFILTPTPTDRTVCVEGCGFPAIYLDASGSEMKWSGRNPLPAIGDRIYVSMNTLGYAKVVGYAESHGWLGLMVEFENPPEWHIKQRARHDASKPQWLRDGIGCIFGAEFRLKKEVKCQYCDSDSVGTWNSIPLCTACSLEVM